MTKQDYKKMIDSLTSMSTQLLKDYNYNQYNEIPKLVIYCSGRLLEDLINNFKELSKTF